MVCRTSLRSLVLMVCLAVTPAVAWGQQWQTAPLGQYEYTVYGPEAAPRYAVRDRDGRALVDSALEPVIRLRDGAFDPVRDEIPAPAPLLRSREDERLFLVQYAIPGMPSFRAALEAEGVEPLQFLPEATDLVRMDAARAHGLRALPFVRAIVPYHPGWRLDAETRTGLLTGALPTRAYNVLVTRPGLAEKAIFA